VAAPPSGLGAGKHVSRDRALGYHERRDRNLLEVTNT
jgi:hypothetical protein